MAADAGSRHGSLRAPAGQNASSVCRAASPLRPGGRWIRSGLPAGRPNAAASAACGGSGGTEDRRVSSAAPLSGPSNAPVTPEGLPKIRSSAGSTGGCSGGRGPSLGGPVSPAVSTGLAESSSCGEAMFSWDSFSWDALCAAEQHERACPPVKYA
jgi:hypothetical protein